MEVKFHPNECTVMIKYFSRHPIYHLQTWRLWKFSNNLAMHTMNKVLKNLRKFSLIACIILMMTGLTTSAMTFASLAGGQTFMAEWLPVWARTALVIAPAGFVLLFFVEKIVRALLPDSPERTLKIATSLGMSLCITSVIAAITTQNMHGWSPAFLSHWSKAMMAGLPVSLAISSLMIFVIKPKMDAIMKS